MSAITITYDNKEYVLEYSRQSVRTMEAQGFNLEEIGSKPMTMIPLLFSGAFLKNNRGIKRSLIDEIFDHMEDKTGLLQALMEIYSENLSTLTDDAVGEGNATWTVTK